LAASLFHFQELSIMQVKEALVAHGVPVRRPVPMDDLAGHAVTGQEVAE
jgi:hypothetical protein